MKAQVKSNRVKMLYINLLSKTFAFLWFVVKPKKLQQKTAITTQIYTHTLTLILKPNWNGDKYFGL